MTYGVALYSDEKWAFKITGETDEKFLCVHFEEDFKRFSKGEQPFALPKRMFGGDCYEVVDENNKYVQRYFRKQLSITDILGEIR